MCMELFPLPEDLCSRLEDEKTQAADESEMGKRKVFKNRIKNMLNLFCVAVILSLLALAGFSGCERLDYCL